MNKRFSPEQIVALRDQCQDIVGWDNESRIYVETGALCDQIEDCLKVEIAMARDMAADEGMDDECRKTWADAVPLLENLLVAVRQEIADGKPVEPVAPNEFENS